MKLIIAGTRTLCPNYSFVAEALSLMLGYSFTTIDEVVSGCAKGVDKSGEAFAVSMNLPVKRFLPDWEKYGKAAGAIRNKQMAEYADALLLIWDGQSRGSANMKLHMEATGKPVYEVILRAAGV